MFDTLPLAAVVDKKILCIHGGLSPLITQVDEIKSVDRIQEMPHDGIMCDLLWSDPSEPDDHVDGWRVSPRGAGYIFGAEVVDKFNRENDLELIARAH